MEIKILQVFYDKDGLPYKDKDRQVHFPILGTGFLGASNTTKIKFYYDELDDTNQTTWVAVSKLPNGRVGSRVLESYLDDELNEHYALLELDNYYTQYKGDVFISLQGYQGGVNVDYDEENSQYEIHGTPTIAATGSIKFTINYANQFVGSGETDNINFQRVLAALGTKLGMRAYSEHVEELPSEGNPDVFYVINDDPNNPTLANIYVWNEDTRHYIWVGDNRLNLGDYYTKHEGDQFEEEVDSRVTNVESELSSVASGSPKGVYATLSDLETAYPTGTNGIYVVVADGNWYYWNSANTEWTAGGVYQSSVGVVPETRKVIGLNLEQDIVSKGFDLMSKFGDDSFEIGAIGISGTPETPSYVSALNGVRTKQGLQIELNIGDTIYLTDYTSLKLDVYFKLDHFDSWRRGCSDITGSVGWITSGKFVAPAHCYAIICIKKYPVENNFSSIEEAINYLVIERTIIENTGEKIDSEKTGKYLIGDLEFRNHLAYGNWYSGFSGYYVNLTRIVNDQILCFDEDGIIYWNNDIQIALYIFDSKTYSSSNVICETGYFAINKCRVFIPKGTYFMIIAKKVDGTSFAIGDADTKIWFRKVDTQRKQFTPKNRNVMSINHRGFNSIAPENTLPAFRLSKQKGYKAVETDILWTSDNVPVLLHDNTINRTARNEDGTVIDTTTYINQITYEQALTYDFGIWKNNVYAGTKIPTFAQFIALCKNIGLSAYVEIKYASPAVWTKTKLQQLIDIVKSYAMEDKITWISFDFLCLYTISEISPTARLGWLTMEGSGSTQVNQCYNNLCLKTGFNEVFAGVYQPRITTEGINKAKELGMSYELYFDSPSNETESNIKNAPKYVKNFTTNELIAEDILYEENIGDNHGIA